MIDIDRTIQIFVASAVVDGLIQEQDQTYIENRLLFLMQKSDLKIDQALTLEHADRLLLLDELIAYALDNGMIHDTFDQRDQLSARIMDLLTPLPSAVNHIFMDKYARSPQEATDYFFWLSKENDYIKTRAIAQNSSFSHSTEFGDLEITINLSKPEKDPKQIALETKKTSVNYPSCLLCMENEGYEGTVQQPARANHRLIRLPINEETWGFQYSPYAYYNEHAIFISEEHRPMNVGPQAIRNLLEITTLLPHYFVGSNAGLPIVGGSILSHDHYQGGRHVFAMEKAPIWHTFNVSDFPSIEFGLVKWPMSVIRLRGKEREKVAEAADMIMNTWSAYSDPSVEIFAETNGEPHNAITPIARRKEEAYELDLVLRNNLTTEAFPDGVYHPHPDVQHIKKENIGLIEVMGLAILPPRLKTEMEEVRLFLLGRLNRVQDYHQTWADQLKKNHTHITEETVMEIIQQGIGDVFLRVLFDAAVFKPTEEGNLAFLRFIAHINRPGDRTHDNRQTNDHLA